MKSFFNIAAATVIALFAMFVAIEAAHAQEDPFSASYYANTILSKDRGQATAPIDGFNSLFSHPDEAITIMPKNAVAKMVAAETVRKLGPKWVNTALRIAKVESGFRCDAVGPRTRHGHAMGVMQVLPSSARALGFSGSSRELRSCNGGVAAGVAHMVSCLNRGATTPTAMAYCHVSGLPYFKSRYAHAYVRMVATARL